jgi:maltose alpha-D-glucosyltransferase/alpha-amylase
MGAAPDATGSASGIPLARALYGSLPDQLADRHSFAARLSQILKVRKRHGIFSGSLLDVPEVPTKEMLVLVNQLAIGAGQVTVLNFGPNKITGRVQSEHIPSGRVFDLSTRRKVGSVDDLGGFTVTLPPFGGLATLIRD